MKKYLLVLFAGLVLSLMPAPAMAQQEDAGLIATMISGGCNPCLQSCLPAGLPANFVDWGFLMGYYDAWWWENLATIEEWAGYYSWFF